VKRLITVTATSVALLAPAEASSARQQTSGSPLVGITELWSRAAPHLDRVLPGQIMRVPLDWRQPLAETDQIYQAMTSRSIRPLFVLQGHERPPLDAWADWVGAVTARYPDTVAFEIWNEPNLIGFWHDPPSPCAYHKLFATAALAAAPSATLITAGLSPTERSKGKRSRRWRSYLRSMVRLGTTDLADGIGYHMYPGLSHIYPDVAPGGPRRVLRKGRRIVGDRPAWITELANFWKPSRRALRSAHRQAVRAGAEAVIVYRLIDDPEDLPPWDETGLLRANGSPKGTWRTLSALDAPALGQSWSPAPPPRAPRAAPSARCAR
jgi:hypothetical protein